MAFAMPGFDSSTPGNSPGDEVEMGQLAPGHVDLTGTRKRSRSERSATRISREQKEAADAAERDAAVAGATETALLEQQRFYEASVNAARQASATNLPKQPISELMRMVSPSMMVELKKASGGVSSDEWFRPILLVVTQSGFLQLSGLRMLYIIYVRMYICI